MAEKTDTLNISEEDKFKLLQLSEISLWLDHYDDIFSDFDSRPYSQRALSDDFLTETKKASRDKEFGKITLKLLVPFDKRDIPTENIIKKRLKEHFKKHNIRLHEEKRKFVVEGMTFVLVGTLLMVIASYVIFKKYSELNFMMNFVIILLEPAGWFFFWEGLRQSIIESRQKNPDVEFYEKMESCTISFISY
jgi:hypothetical protein